jgi:hypothetical protein
MFWQRVRHLIAGCDYENEQPGCVYGQLRCRVCGYRPRD